MNASTEWTPPIPSSLTSRTKNAVSSIDVSPNKRLNGKKSSSNLEANNDPPFHPRRLLALLKTWSSANVNSDTPNTTTTTSSIATILSQYEIQFERYGFHLTDVPDDDKDAAAARRQHILANISAKQNNNKSGGGGGKKRGNNKRKKGRNGNANASLATPLQTTETAVAAETTLEELQMMALDRILEIDLQELYRQHDETIVSVLTLAARCIIALCNYATSMSGASSNNSPDVCVEREILYHYANTYVQGLSRQLHALENMYSSNTTNTYFGIPLAQQKDKIVTNPATHSADSTVVARALICCLHATTSLISMCGVQLSRCSVINPPQPSKNNGTTSASTKIPALSIQACAWRILGACGSSSSGNPDVSHASAQLLSTLPLAGNREGVPPSKLWCTLLMQSLEALQLVLVSSTSSSASNNTKINGSTPVANKGDYDGWFQNLQQQQADDLLSPEMKYRAIFTRIHGFVTLLLSILSLDTWNTSKTITLPMDQLLELCHVMIHYGTGAEHQLQLVLQTSSKKKRKQLIQSETLLTSEDVVRITNPIRGMGYDILSSMLSLAASASAVALFPHTQSIVSMVTLGMRNACSVSIQNQLSSIINGNGTTSDIYIENAHTKKKWLPNSLLVRRNAIQTFRRVVLTLGSGVVLAQPRNSMACIMMVAACLYETTTTTTCTNGDLGWGTTEEMSLLSNDAAETLACCFSTGGGTFLPDKHRATIESIVIKCLSSLSEPLTSSISSHHSLTKMAILQLGVNILCSPWKDGGASSRGNLSTTLKRTAMYLRKNDRNINVAASASSALCVCDALMTPRSPPLVIVTRSTTTSTIAYPTSDGIFEQSYNINVDSNNSNKISTGLNTVGNSTFGVGMNSLNKNVEVQKQPNLPTSTSSPHQTKNVSNTGDKNMQSKLIKPEDDENERKKKAKTGSVYNKKRISSDFSLPLENEKKPIPDAMQGDTCDKKDVLHLLDESTESGNRIDHCVLHNQVNTKPAISTLPLPGKMTQVVSITEPSLNIGKVSTSIGTAISLIKTKSNIISDSQNDDVYGDSCDDDDLPMIVDCDPDEEDQLMI